MTSSYGFVFDGWYIGRMWIALSGAVAVLWPVLEKLANPEPVIVCRQRKPTKITKDHLVRFTLSRSILQAPWNCAIYTRKSTEEGLEQEFNSLDAQREAAEAFVLSQRREGWIALPELYDDGGFTGANMERPALTRLLRAAEAGELDCVVVYKVDRLSRSLLDFTRMLSVFEKHKVSLLPSPSSSTPARRSAD
jgi:hypothetical protein